MSESTYSGRDGAGGAARKSYTLKEMISMELPEPSWAVPSFIPVGLTLFAGKPKAGKSWMGLSLGFEIATGGRALSWYDCPPGEVLYLGLEDSLIRLKDRVLKMYGDDREWPDRFHVYTEWDNLASGGYQALDDWLTAHPETRLVVIDTLARIRPPQKKGGNGYDDDYALTGNLQALALRHNVSIFALCHLRKATGEDVFDQVSGTLGLNGGADAILILQRPRNDLDGTLHLTGRDVEEQELAVQWNKDTGLWRVLGDASTQKWSRARKAVIDVVTRAAQPPTTEEIANRLGRENNGGFRRLLLDMLDGGQLTRDPKMRWGPALFIPPPPSSPSSSSYQEG